MTTTKWWQENFVFCVRTVFGVKGDRLIGSSSVSNVNGREFRIHSISQNTVPSGHRDVPLRSLLDVGTSPDTSAGRYRDVPNETTYVPVPRDVQETSQK